MPSRWRWILALAGVTALDLLARFGTSFNFARVMHVEAVLFPITAVALATLLRYEPSSQGWPRVVRIGLLWLFALAGLRPMLWTLGLPLGTANLATLVPALAGVLVSLVRRRHRSLGGPSRGAA